MTRSLSKKEVLTAAGSEAIAVNGTATVYSKAFSLEYAIMFGLSALASSAGTVNVQVDIEQSFKLPVNEGNADVYWAVPEGTNPIVTLTNTTIKHDVVNATPLKYIRYKLTGLTGNDASTVVNLWHSQQDDLS